jgi:hypothetical protein
MLYSALAAAANAPLLPLFKLPEQCAASTYSCSIGRADKPALEDSTSCLCILTFTHIILVASEGRVNQPCLKPVLAFITLFHTQRLPHHHRLSYVMHVSNSVPVVVHSDIDRACIPTSVQFRAVVHACA